MYLIQNWLYYEWYNYVNIQMRLMYFTALLFALACK